MKTHKDRVYDLAAAMVSGWMANPQTDKMNAKTLVTFLSIAAEAVKETETQWPGDTKDTLP